MSAPLTADGLVWGVLIAVALFIVARLFGWATRNAKNRWDDMSDYLSDERNHS